MSLFRWFSRESRQGAGSQAPRRQDESGARQTQRRERSARREQLHVIVREAMVRVGILSAGYKFKVLSLDSSGQRFVVMVDLAPAYAADTLQQRNIESLIAELARTRMDAGVHAVYWRVNGQIQTAQAAGSVTPQVGIAASAAGAVGTVGTQPILGGSAFEPIDSQEIDAFKQAVSPFGAASSGARQTPRAQLLGPGSGHEEGDEFAVSGLGTLGGTQYGELR